MYEEENSEILNDCDSSFKDMESDELNIFDRTEDVIEDILLEDTIPTYTWTAKNFTPKE
jgi:hypothetical protein